MAKRILFYLGTSTGEGLLKIIKQNYYHMFNEVHIFEAQKESFDTLLKSFEPVKEMVKNTFFFNYGAVVPYETKTDDECVEFNIYKKNGSSSLGVMSKECFKDEEDFKNVLETRQVPAINIPQYCKKRGIENIHTYVSDLQGIDFEVLKSMKSFIDQQKIYQIQCEVTKNGKRNMYETLPSNELQSFEKLFGNNYKLSSKGWFSGLMPPDWQGYIEENAWEFDALFIRT